MYSLFSSFSQPKGSKLPWKPCSFQNQHQANDLNHLGSVSWPCLPQNSMLIAPYKVHDSMVSRAVKLGPVVITHNQSLSLHFGCQNLLESEAMCAWFDACHIVTCDLSRIMADHGQTVAACDVTARGDGYHKALCNEFYTVLI